MSRQMTRGECSYNFTIFPTSAISYSWELGFLACFSFEIVCDWTIIDFKILCLSMLYVLISVFGLQPSVECLHRNLCLLISHK